MHLLKNTYFLKVLKVVFPLTILIIIYIEGKKQIQSIDIQLVFRKIHEIGFVSFFWLLFIGILAVATMIFYDVFVSQKMQISIPFKNIVWQGFTANAYANFLGFGGFAGVGLRTIFYKKYTKKVSKLLKCVAVILPYMLIGLSFFAWTVLIKEWHSPIFLDAYPILKFPLIIMCGYGFFIMLVGHFAKTLTKKSQVILFGISLLEWLAAAFVFWQVSIVLEINISAWFIFLTFFLAAIAGVLSTVPGGIGAFDFVVLVGLSPFGASEEKLIALLFLYRLVYYVIPFLLSSVFFLHHLYKEKAWKSLLPDHKTWSVLCHRILSIWVLMTGALLLLFPVIPTVVQRLKFANQFLSMEMMQISQQFSIAIGITLLVLARAIEDQVKRAYYFTLFILLLGTMVSLSKGFHFGEAFLLLIAMLLLYFSRSLFFRRSSQYTIGKGVIDGLILMSISFLYVIVGSMQIPYLRKIVPRRLQDLFALHPQELLNDVGIGIGLAIVLIFFGLFFHKGKMPSVFFQKASSEIKNEGGLLSAHKSLYVYTIRNARIYYHKWMDNIVVLKRVESDSSTIDRALQLYREFENEIDKYGFVLIIPDINALEHQQFQKAGFQIVEEKGKVFAMSKRIPQIVAKINVRWLIRIIQKTQVK